MGYYNQAQFFVSTRQCSMMRVEIINGFGVMLYDNLFNTEGFCLVLIPRLHLY